MSILEDAGWKKPEIKILQPKGSFKISDNANTLITEDIEASGGIIPVIFNYSFNSISLSVTYHNRIFFHYYPLSYRKAASCVRL